MEKVGNIPPVPASVAPPLTVGYKISYGLGATAEAITFQASSMFLLIYCTSSDNLGQLAA